MRTPTAHTSIARIWRSAGRVVRGLLAAALLAALVAGLPWALSYGVGWPLPEHLPSPDEIRSVLMSPISSRFLLDALACLAWLLWLVFLVDVTACAVDVARGARWEHLRTQTGPLRRIAAALVGALLVAVLGRTVTGAATMTGQSFGHGPMAATAPAETRPVAGATEPLSTAETGIERVRSPEHGVHDSLWRIAQRNLGDGARWPDIWSLNEGSAQPGGRVLKNPNRIHPGDTLLMPETHHPAAPAPSRPSEQAPEAERPAADAVPPATAPPPERDPSSTPATGTPPNESGAVSWGGGEVFVSLGLAAAISALLVLARRRRQARYRPGGRDDMPVTPVVYQLRQAHLRARHQDEDTDLETERDQQTDDPARHQSRHDHAPTAVTPAPDISRPRHSGTRNASHLLLASGDRRLVTASGTGLPEPSTVVDMAIDATGQGVEGGRAQLAFDLAGVHGLGLVGPGGYAAARALLLTLLTTAPHGQTTPKVLVPAADLVRVLGVPVAATDLPDTVIIVPDLDTALKTLETAPPPRSAVLVATPPGDPHQRERLEHLLDTSVRHGITALLLGQWRAGVTAYVNAGGNISATSPGLGEPLRGTRAFTLPETATRDLLVFLRAARSPEGASSSRPAQPESISDGPERLEITSAPRTPDSPASDMDEMRPEPPPAAEQGPGTPPPLALTVFGAPALHWRPGPGQADAEPRDLSGTLSSRPVELLVFLAVHPSGVTRDGIVDALWPDQPPRNPASVLRTVISRIRRTLDTATRGTVADPVLAERGHYRLDPAVVEVDFWNFTAALTARRVATTPEQRAAADEAIVAHYGGLLAEGLDSEWLVAAREATRRDALDAVAALARTRVRDDPDYTLDLLETARAFDPHNELLYRDIMRLQHALGRHDAISRTLTLLQTRLAELDTAPSADTAELAQRLRSHHTGIPVGDLQRSTVS